MLATAGSEVSITKYLGTDGADVLAGNGVHKVIVIATILQVPAESTKVLNPINIKFSNRIWFLAHGLGREECYCDQQVCITVHMPLIQESKGAFS